MSKDDEDGEEKDADQLTQLIRVFCQGKNLPFENETP